MPTLNYVTLKYPGQLDKHLDVIQSLEAFKVCRYKFKKGIIFRIPHGVQIDDICHFFIEHEVNFTNTLKTGTLSLKVQVTVVPCHMGVFSGFDEVKGSYSCEWEDEDGYSFGSDRFVPDYDRSRKNIVPLPASVNCDFGEILNKLLLQEQTDIDVISRYAVALGCQKELLKDKVVFVPTPVFKSAVNGPAARAAHSETMDFFNKLMVDGSQICLFPKRIG